MAITGLAEELRIIILGHAKLLDPAVMLNSAAGRVSQQRELFSEHLVSLTLVNMLYLLQIRGQTTKVVDAQIVEARFNKLLVAIRQKLTGAEDSGVNLPLLGQEVFN